MRRACAHTARRVVFSLWGKGQARSLALLRGGAQGGQEARGRRTAAPALKGARPAEALMPVPNRCHLGCQISAFRLSRSVPFADTQCTGNPCARWT